jgi:hypothetical protein
VAQIWLIEHVFFYCYTDKPQTIMAAMLLNSANQLNVGPPQPSPAPVPQPLSAAPQALIPSVQDYSSQVLNAPKYVMKQRPTTVGANTATIQPNQVNTQVAFELPVGVWNLSRFKLHYDWSIPAPGAGVYNCVAANQVPFLASMRLVSNNTSTAIQEVQNLQRWTQSCRVLETDLQQYMACDPFGYKSAWPPNQTQAGVAAVVGQQWGNPLGVASPVAGGFDSMGPHRQQIVPGNSAMFSARFETGPLPGALVNAPALATQPLVDLTESFAGQRYVSQGQANQIHAGTTDISLAQLFPKNTSYFGMDIDSYYPNVIYLQLQFGPGNLTAWTSTGAGEPGTGAAALGAAQAVTLSNIQLYMAVQSNESLANRTIAKVRSGQFRLPIPYVYHQRIQPGGAIQTVQQRFDNTFGALLKTIYTVLYNGTESTNTAQDRNNTDGRRVREFYESINSNRLTDYNVDCRNGEAANTSYPNLDWQYMKPWLIRSPLGLSSSVYQYNWILKTDFSGQSAAGSKGVPDQNIVGGLNIFNQSQLYSLQATMGTDNTITNYVSPVWYQWYIVQKMLIISPSGDSKVV